MSKHKWAPSMLTLYSDTRGIWFNVRDDDTFQPFLIHTRTSPTYTRAHRKYWLDWMLKNTHKHTHTPLALCIAAAGNRDKTEPSARARGGKKERLPLVVSMETVSLSVQGEGKRLVDDLGWHLRWLVDRVVRNLRWFEVWIHQAFSPRGWEGSFTVMAVRHGRLEQTVKQRNDNWGPFLCPFTLGCTVSMLSSRTHTHRLTHSHTDYLYLHHRSVHNFITTREDDVAVSVSHGPNNCKNNRTDGGCGWVCDSLSGSGCVSDLYC